MELRLRPPNLHSLIKLVLGNSGLGLKGLNIYTDELGAEMKPLFTLNKSSLYVLEYRRENIIESS